jgi:hypothetical protein
VPVGVALPPPEDRSFADVWTALGGELKLSLDIVVTAPTNTGRAVAAGPAVEKPAVLVAEGLPGSVPRETARRRAIGDAAIGEAASSDGTRPATAPQIRVRKRPRRH